MMMDSDKWRLVQELAEKAGVSYEARRKWRIRGVPPAWQIRLVAAAPRRLSFSDFLRKQKDAAA
jgi:hypothetical protein